MSKTALYINQTVPCQVDFDISAFIQQVLLLLDIQDGSISITFIDNAHITTLNQKYLNKNNATDIITFNLEDENDPLMGDIYISVEDAKNNATSLNHSFSHEIKTLLIHGILHLLGYRDYTEEEKSDMFEKQNALLKKVSTT